MRRGALDKTVALQSDVTGDFVTYAMVPALVAPVVPGDVDAQKVWIEFRSDVARHDRVVFEARTLHIRDVNNPRQRDRELVLYCTDAIYHTVTIEDFVALQDDFGEEVKTWQTFATRPARIEPLRGSESWNAQQVHAEVTHRVTLRWLDGLSPTMRVVHDGRNLDIESIINPDERGDIVELMCIERVP